MATRIQLVLLLVLSAVITSRAATIYWVGTTNVWGTTSNWSTNSLPGINDDVVFDGSSNVNCSINVTPSIKSLTLNGYTGTLLQIGNQLFVTSQLSIATGLFQTNRPLTVGSFNQTGGTFIGTSGGTSSPINVANNFTQTGGTFTAGSATMTIGSLLPTIITGSFSQAGGTFTSTSGTMLIYGNADFNSSGSGIFNSNNGTINFRTITDTGGNITITSSSTTLLNNIIISAKNASSSVHTVSNNLTANDVTFDLINGPGKIRFFIGPSGSLTVNGALTFTAGAMEHYLTGGKIYAKGNININGTANIPTDNVNPATIEISGSGVQTMTSTVGKKQNRLPNIIINKPTGGLALVGLITVCGDWKYITGTVTPGTSNLYIYQPSSGLPITVSGTHALADVLVELDYYIDGLTIINNLTVNNFTLDAASAGKINLNAGTLTVNKTFDLIGTGANGIVFKGGTVFAKGDINLSASYTNPDVGNTSTIVINGAVDQTVTGNTTLGACILPNITIDKTGGVVTFKNTITMQGDWMYVKGTVDATTYASTVYLNSLNVAGVNRRIDGQGSIATMQFNHLSLQNNGNSVLLDGALAVTGNLSIAAASPTQATLLNTSGTTAHNPVNIGGDLSGAGTLVPNNSVITLDGTVDQSFYQLLPITIKTLEVNKPSGKVNLNANVIISATSGQLRLTQGIISVPASGKLTLKNLATTVPAIGSATSYIDGALNLEVALNGTRTLNLPLGVASLNVWRPAEFTIQQSNATLYTYTAQIKNSPARLLPYSVPSSMLYVSGVRYLQITANIPSSSFSQSWIKLYFGDDDQVNDLNYLGVVVAKAASSSATPSAWTDITSGPGTGSGSPFVTGSISSAFFPPILGSSGFTGHFALATKTGTPTNVNPLPIELSSFTVDAQSNNAFLQWTTQVEINNDYFIVERAEGNQPFNELTRITGAHTSKSPVYYSWLDKNLPAGKLYYRLKQVDFDGKFTYSKVISFSRQDAQELPFTIYPLPVLYSTVYFNTLSTVRIISSTGQTLASYENVEQVDVSNLASGIYYIVNEKGSAKKMIIMR